MVILTFTFVLILSIVLGAVRLRRRSTGSQGSRRPGTSPRPVEATVLKTGHLEKPVPRLSSVRALDKALSRLATFSALLTSS